MEKFVLLQRGFLSGDIDFYNIEAEDIDKAYEIVEESYADSNSQEWLLDENSYAVFKKAFNTFKNQLSPEAIEEHQLEEARERDYERKQEQQEREAEAIDGYQEKHQFDKE